MADTADVLSVDSGFVTGELEVSSKSFALTLQIKLKNAKALNNFDKDFIFLDELRDFLTFSAEDKLSNDDHKNNIFCTIMNCRTAV